MITQHFHALLQEHLKYLRREHTRSISATAADIDAGIQQESTKDIYSTQFCISHIVVHVYRMEDLDIISHMDVSDLQKITLTGYTRILMQEQQ